MTDPSEPLLLGDVRWDEHTPAYDAADLTTCDTEPIHVPGAIQPHGVLLAVDPESLTVITVSENCEHELGRPVEEVLGLGLADLIGAGAAAEIVSRIADDMLTEPLAVVLPGGAGALSGQEVDVALNPAGERLLVEFERLERTRSAPMGYRSARAAMTRITAHESVHALAEQLTHEIATLTGFDRVMVYRFDTEWNGEVIAEQKREDLNPFLGLHYPATDIPAQARRLYTENWIRLIADLGYRPSRLAPLTDPATGAPLDLTHSTLRSVSPVHVEYLQNMGVTASMSISLVHEGRLWGLVACHHYAGPLQPAQDARAAAEFLGQVASLRIAELERAERAERRHATTAALTRINERLTRASDSVVSALLADPELLSLMGACGVAVWSDDHLSTVGQVPPRSSILALARSLDGEEGRADILHASNDLPHEVGPDVELRGLAGVLFIGSLAGRWIAWFRPEFEQVVDWGGDPKNKQLARDENDRVRLSPRKSFERWREVIDGRSAPWDRHHPDAARALLSQLNALLLKRARDQIAVAESLQRSVAASWASRIEGMDVAVRYRPSSTYQLGGDWWDYVALDEHRGAFVIGDVAGHGVEAVAAMTEIRAALRAYLFAGITVTDSLDQLDLFVASLLDEHVASAAVVVVDRRTASIEISVAGHPQPLVLPTEPSIAVGASLRPILGLGAGQASTRRMRVEPGTTLLLFTDGLIERRGVDLMVSLDQLRERAGLGPGTEDLERWLDELVASLPGAGDDDTTALAIRLH